MGKVRLLGFLFISPGLNFVSLGVTYRRTTTKTTNTNRRVVDVHLLLDCNAPRFWSIFDVKIRITLKLNKGIKKVRQQTNKSLKNTREVWKQIKVNYKDRMAGAVCVH